MAVSTVDGTIEEAVLKRSRRNLRVYERVVFRLPDGGSKTWAKAVCDASVAQHLQPGNKGRFYLYTAVDHRGIHGLRDTDGHAVFGYPKNNETAMLVVAILGATITVLLFFLALFSGWALFCMALGIPFYFIYRNSRLSAERQFEADSLYRPAGP